MAALLRRLSQSTTDQAPNDVGYAAFRIYKRRLVQRLLRAAIARSGPPGQELALIELGCGDGGDLDFVLRWEPTVTRFRLSLVDGDPESLRVARARIGQHAVAGASFDQVDLAGVLPYGDGVFQIALCSEVVEHLNDPGQLLAEARRVLRPGGFLVLTTDNDPTLQARVRQVLRFRSAARRREERNLQGDLRRSVTIAGAAVKLNRHVHVASTVEWERACRAAGFEVVQFGTYESVRRHTTGMGSGRIALVFAAAYVNSLLPGRVGRYFGSTTALLLRNPQVFE